MTNQVTINQAKQSFGLEIRRGPDQAPLTIPQEIVFHIFSLLDEMTLQSTVRVSRYWKEVTIQVNKSAHLAALAQLLPRIQAAVGDRFDSTLNTLSQKISGSTGMQEIYSHVLPARIKIRDLLHTIPQEELVKMHELQTNKKDSTVLDTVLLEVMLYNRFELAKKEPDPTKKNSALFELCVAFAKIGNSHQLIQILEMLTPQNRYLCIVNSVEIFIASGLLNRAKQIALNMTYGLNNRDYILTLIAIAFAKRGDLVSVSEIDRRIPHDFNRTIFYITIADTCAQSGHFIEALQAVKLITEPLIQERSYKCISKECAKTGNLLMTLEILSHVKTPCIDTIRVLNNHFRTSEIEELDKQLRSTHSIEKTNTWLSLMTYISMLYIFKENLEKSLEIANLMELKSDRNQLLNTLILILVEQKCPEEAAYLFETVDFEFREDHVGIAISRCFTDQGEFEKGLGFTSKIKTSSNADCAILMICEALNKKGDFTRATLVAEQIHHESVRDATLKKIPRVPDLLDSIQSLQEHPDKDSSAFDISLD